MTTIEKLKEEIRKNLPDNRFSHSLRVMKTAKTLAKVHNVDGIKAQIAGLLHDCARALPLADQLKMAEDFGILLDEIEKRDKVLIHGPLGAVLARKVYNISDDEILRAIRVHTTGDTNMTRLDKVIFLSDLIEPHRDFPGVHKLREKAFKDLDVAVVSALNSTIRYIIDKGGLLHPRTIESRNFLLIQRESEGML